jgi:uncharacterized membrane protein
MGKITGERSVEIDAPIQRVFDIAADIENAPDWQGSLKDVDVLERDADGRATLVDTVNDAKVKTVKNKLSFTYNSPTEIRWRQEKGDVKALDGWWTLEDLGGDRTRATYALEVDPGRMLGMLIRGPVEDALRGVLVNGRPGELKARVEGG